MNEPQREMTLKEYIEVLPKDHIARKAYNSLLESEAKLEALESMGVDNWSGYDDAMEYLRTGELP